MRARDRAGLCRMNASPAIRPGPRPPIVAAGLGPVTAVGHVAPTAAVVAAGVEEEPAAVIAGTLAHPVEASRCQQLSGGIGNWPARQVEIEVVDLPGELKRAHRGTRMLAAALDTLGLAWEWNQPVMAGRRPGWQECQPGERLG